MTRFLNLPDFGYFNYGLEKLPHSVPKGPLGLVQGKVFSGKLILFASLSSNINIY
jgi:hypothetical protein